MSSVKKLQLRLSNWRNRCTRIIQDIGAKHIISAVSFVIVLISIVGYMLYGSGSIDFRRFADTQPAQLRFNPRREVIKPGEVAIVEILLDSGGYAVTGMELYVNSLDTNTVKILDVEAVHPDLSVVVGKTVNPQQASVTFVPTCAETCNSFSGRDIVARITIAGVNKGRSELTFGGTLLSGLGSEVNVLGQAHPMSVTVR